LSKSLLLQIARQPTDKKMVEMFHRIMQGGLTRDEARRERREEQAGPQRPRPFIFQFEPPSETFRFRIQFKKSHVSRDELISTLREILAQRSEVHTSELQSPCNLVCRLLLEKKKMTPSSDTTDLERKLTVTYTAMEPTYDRPD